MQSVIGIAECVRRAATRCRFRLPLMILSLSVLLIAISSAAHASYRDSERWFNSLDFEERTAIQLALIWAGTYNGLVDGEVGRRTYRSIQEYQRSIGAPPTGILSEPQLDALMAGARQLMTEIGFDIVFDRSTGLSFALPTALLSPAGSTRRGSRWASADRSIEIETISMPTTERSYLQLYERLSRDRGDRRVTYRTFKPSFFVVSGYIGPRRFYSRYQPGPTATGGFSMAWDPSLSVIMDRVAVAMSSLLMHENGVHEPSTPDVALDEPGRPEQEQKTDDKLFQGTGFFVSPAGHVVTNHHVIEQCREALIRLTDGTIGEANIVARSSQDDLAILQADVTPPAVAEFRDGQPVRLGDSVIVFGFPLIDMLGTTGGVLTTGHVSALAGPRDHPGILQMTAPVQSGNSGGPLLDQSGNVIGVVTAKTDIILAQDKLEVLQNMNFAVKSSIVTNMLDAHGVPYLSGPSQMEQPIPDIAEAARQFTALVVCR